MDAIANVGAKYHHTSPIQLGECRNHGFLHRSDQSDNLTIKIGMISSLQFANNNNDDIFKPVWPVQDIELPNFHPQPALPASSPRSRPFVLSQLESPQCSCGTTKHQQGDGV